MKLSPDLERHRVRQGHFASESFKPFGQFHIPCGTVLLKVIACDGLETGWDHVSVSLLNRCPNWKEMCYIKSLFWDEEETVLQFHPKKSEYVSNCDTCLHMWKPTTFEVKLPPRILV